MSVRSAWEAQEREGSATTAWFDVRLAFTDGAQVDVLAVVREAGVSIEDVRAQPALSLDDPAALADWIEGPLIEYRAAQEEGADPVLAVMCATGRSRRRSLRLISQARDAGYLTPHHARR